VSRNRENIFARLERLKNEFAEAEKNSMTLPPPPMPSWGEGMSAIMNALARSAAFSPIKRGCRSSLFREKIHALNGYEIVLTGEETDEADRDVYLNAIRLYSAITPGTPCRASIRSFLNGIGRSYGKSNREWLFQSLKRLANLRLEIQFNLPAVRGFYAGSIFNILALEGEENREGILSFSVPPDFIHFFMKDYTKIPMKRRLSLAGEGSQMAKRIQTFVYTHDAPYPMKLETLQPLLGAGGTPASFRKSLARALGLLKKSGDLEKWSIKEGVLRMIRPKSSLIR
jgi:hypothetical protein